MKLLYRLFRRISNKINDRIADYHYNDFMDYIIESKNEIFNFDAVSIELNIRPNIMYKIIENFWLRGIIYSIPTEKEHKFKYFKKRGMFS